MATIKTRVRPEYWQQCWICYWTGGAYLTHMFFRHLPELAPEDYPFSKDAIAFITKE